MSNINLYKIDNKKKEDFLKNLNYKTINLIMKIMLR